MGLAYIFPASAHNFAGSTNYISWILAQWRLALYTSELIAWLRTTGLLARSQSYSLCNSPMREGRRNDVTGGAVFSANTQKRIEGSFLRKSRLFLQKWLLVHFWSTEVPTKDETDDIEIHKNTALYRWLTEVCSRRVCSK